MTSEMIRAILALALTKLIEVPPATLRSYQPWLRRAHIRWCLDHLEDFHPWDDTEQSTRALLHEMRDLLAQHTPPPARAEEPTP